MAYKTWRHELEASRLCCCEEVMRLSKRAAADFRCRRRSRPQPVRSPWSHQTAEKFQASAWSGVERQTQYFRPGRISGPWLEVRISRQTRRTDEGHSDIVCGRAPKKPNCCLPR